MNEVLEKMVGKRCIVQADGDISGTVGMIKQVSGGWLELENDKGLTVAINTLFITQVKEAPEKKKK